MGAFLRVCAAVPALKLADPIFNGAVIERVMAEANEKQAAVLVLPELALTGATCGDLFRQRSLLLAVEHEIERLAGLSSDTLVVLGTPLAVFGKLYNCAVLLQNGRVVGISPKYRLTHAESRYFSVPAVEAFETVTHIRAGERLFSFEACLGGMPTQPTAGLTVCLDANPSVALGVKHKQNSAMAMTAASQTALIYANAGFYESTTDYVFDGLSLIAENGEVLEQSNVFSPNGQAVYTDLNCILLNSIEQPVMRVVDLHTIVATERKLDREPFMPKAPERPAFFEDILKIQTAGLLRRFLHVDSKCLIVGTSGGLDSALSLVISALVADAAGVGRDKVIAVTMPGFGTSKRTKQNAYDLMEGLGVTVREIPIGESCKQHLTEIGHDLTPDLAYENAQARERTQILLDLANMHRGIVVGTGDFSEAALGFCTFNGDHISNYNVNAGLPKTVISALALYIADSGMFTPQARQALKSIVDTPISPELLPTDDAGAIAQKTEAILGSYLLNDFFLYYIINYGLNAQDVLTLAENAFSGIEREKLNESLNAFYMRFSRAQFKRNCSSDGPSVLGCSLSPRGGFVMPSDVMFVPTV